MANTKIEWADAVWNPVTGCTPISPGCENCYASRMAVRLRGRCGYPKDEPFRVTLHPERLEEPLKWKKPRRVFVNSMGDLFHEDVPFEFIESVFATMALAEHHTFLVLTKRPLRMLEFFEKAVYNGRGDDPLPNVYLGVTAENQEQADKRIPVLLQIPAAVRFVSVEPMLGTVNLKMSNYEKSLDGVEYYGSFVAGLGWVIAGGESGPGARPCHPDWVRSLRDQCQVAGVPFFFKHWGEWVTEFDSEEEADKAYDLSVNQHTWPDNSIAFRVGKKKAGRILDGRTWEEFPG